MKRININYYITMIALSVLLFSCKKEFVSNDTQVGVSNITNYPTFTITGDAFTSVVKGSTYTDAGAKAKEGTADLKVTTTGTVNTAAVGLYILTYSATNKDGFAGTAKRYVAVLPEAEAAGVNISGAYTYAAGGATVTMTKKAPGLYYVTGIYSAATVIPAYLICSNGTNITVPLQDTPYGRLRGTAVLAGMTPGSTLNYTIDLLDQGITGSTRRWLKQ